MEIVTSDDNGAVGGAATPDRSPSPAAGPGDVCLHMENVVKRYGSGKNALTVLDNFCMTVRKHSIYGLLGSSGCGKTTTLRCLLGRTPLVHGEVNVMGAPPNTPGHGVPGSLVGYMPQETTLYKNFSIEETMNYFGVLHKMPKAYIEQRTAFLVDFLGLPSAYRRVGSLSGGQMRRVSFAVALLHEPDLLVLDEPTVGVDPLLRTKIWKHLMEIVEAGSATVIITTHYIEEANQAHTVGLLRDGVLLAEASPKDLLRIYQMDSLEDVFLSLCIEQQRVGNVGMQASQAIQSPDTQLSRSSRILAPILSAFSSSSINNSDRIGVGGSHDGESDAGTTTDAGSDDDRAGLVEGDGRRKSMMNRFLQGMKRRSSLATFRATASKESVFSLRHCAALMQKDFINVKQNIPFLLFQFALPVIVVALFLVVCGKKPEQVKVLVINHEASGRINTSSIVTPAPPYSTNDTDAQPLFGIYEKKLLSFAYLKQVSSQYIDLENAENTADAIERIKSVNATAMLTISPRFTSAIRTRFLEGSRSTNKTLDDSTIFVRLDKTSFVLAESVKEELIAAYSRFTKALAAEFSQGQVNPKVFDTPIEYETPVYGHSDADFQQYLIPGIITSITYFLSMGLTSMLFVTERKEGLLDRSIISGAKPLEMVISHLVSQMLIMIVQVIILYVISFLAFKVECAGPPWIPVALTIGQGITGMVCGLFVTAVCDQEATAMQMNIGIFFPMAILSTIFWTDTGIRPEWAKTIAKVLPLLVPTRAVRDVTLRGWSLTRHSAEVWAGFGVNALWTVGVFFIALFIIRFRQM